MAVAGDERIAAVRAFNRFYTGVIGVLREGLLDTPYSLTEARVLFELGQRGATEVGDLRDGLHLDAGYLSRILGRFEGDGLVTRHRSTTDARRQVVRLTGDGQAAFALLDRRSAAEIGDLLGGLAEGQQRRLVDAMGVVRTLLEPSEPPSDAVLRPPRPGDLGWVVQRHGALYAAEYGWDATFEGLVARIVADFAGRDDPDGRAWIADVGGEPAGCVFCMRTDDRVAQLRLLLVEPRVRGMGVGSRLVEECIAFAGAAGYEELTLWTNDVLTEARRLYERAGFTLRGEEPHHSFGHDLVGQHWSRRLAG